MNKISLAAALLIASASTGVAAEWLHASAPMGQYEGQLRVSDDNMVTYGCSISSNVDFVVEGTHSGPATVVVDGKPVVTGEAGPTSDGKSTMVSFRVDHESPKSALHGHNYLIHSLAEGSEVSLVQGDKVLHSWTLKGSSDITNCGVHVSRN